MEILNTLSKLVLVVLSIACIVYWIEIQKKHRSEEMSCIKIQNTFCDCLCSSCKNPSCQASSYVCSRMVVKDQSASEILVAMP